MNLLTKINSFFPSLTKSERRVAQYILTNPNEIETISIQKLASYAKVGESTIIRFLKKIEVPGFQNFKIELAKDQMKEKNESTIIKKNDPGIVYTEFKKSLDDTYNLLNSQDTKLDSIAQKIVQAECVYLFAVGNSATLAEDFSNQLVRIGKKTIFHFDSHNQAIYSSIMTERDVGFAITVSGNTKDVLENLSLAKENKASIIAITNYIKSGVTTLADDLIICSATRYSSLYRSAAPTVAQIYALNILIRKIIDINKEEVIKLNKKTNDILIKRLD